MSEVTTDQHILNRARYWRETEKALLANKKSEQAQSQHIDAKRQLRMAVDIANAKAGQP